MNYHVDLTDAYRAKLREDLTYLSQYAKAHPDVPIVLNEFGVMCGKSYESDAHEWLSTVREFCDANKIAWAHFEYTDFNNFKGMASRSHPTGDTWRTNVVDALFPKGWDDVPGTYGQVDLSAFSRKVTVSFTGYAGTAPLVDFPVLVKLSTAISGFSYADFQKANGGDLRFVDSHGNLIPHEIDTWNSSGVSTVWVKVPELSASTRIYACYGCANPPAVTAMDVWDDDYVGVWHLGEGTLPLRESTRRGPSFTQKCGEGVGFASSGVVGSSVAFGNSFSNGVLAVDHDNLDGFEKLTVEVWTNQDSHKTNAGILSKRSGPNKAVSYYLYDTGSKTAFNASDTGTNLVVSTSLMTPVADGAWKHQAYSLDTTTSSDNVKGYLNGTSTGASSKSAGRVNADIAFLTLGNLNANAKDTSFNGSIDEVRISKCVRSADWIKATHDTVAKADFATYAVEGVTPVEPDRILYVNVAAGVTNTLDAALVTENITNIVKQGSGTLVASAIAEYEGDFTLEGGVFSVGVKNGAGKHGYANSIYVGSGASLEFTGSEGGIFNAKNVVLEGAAAAGATGKFISNGGWYTIGSSMSFTLKSDAEFAACRNQRLMISSSTFDLGGKTLTVKNSGANQAQFDNSTFRNGGHVVVGEYMTILHESGTLTFETPISGSPSVILMSNATFNLKTAVSASGWTLYATNSNATITGNATRWPKDVNNAVWDGSLVLGGNNKIASYQGSSANVSNNVFNLKGAISGSGTLNLGPGWLNLHTANNTYSGAVWVNGRSAPNVAAPILAGGGGIGLWNGAACFPNASSITFTNTARLAFMDNTKCSVGNVKFVALAGETQSISGGVHTARSTIAGIVKEGAGTLVVDSPAQITGLADIQAGTLKLANRANPQGQTNAEVLAPMPVFASLAFASGTEFDLSDTIGYQIADLSGSPVVTNAGLFGVTGKWTLMSPGDVMNVTGDNPTLVGSNAAGLLAFAEGATFEFKDVATESAYSNAVVAAGSAGIVVARARWVMEPGVNLGEVTLAVPQPSSATSQRWEMRVADNNTTVRLFLATASGYAAWVAEKGLSGDAAAFEKETNGIKNGIRYAFDIDPTVATVGDPIIKVVRDADGNPVVETRALASGRSDVTFGILASEDLKDWTTLVPMKQFTTDGYWKPSASEDDSNFAYPAQMFFKYTIEVK